MNLKVSDLYDLSLGLADLSDKELEIGLSLKVERAHKVIREELVASDNVRQKIIEKYKEKDLENGQVKIKTDRLESFNKEINELMDQEVEADIKKINLDELKKENISIKPKTLMQINSIINAE